MCQYWVHSEFQMIFFSKHTHPSIINFQLISYDFFSTYNKFSIDFLWFISQG